MSWLKMDDAMGDHRKTRRLIRKRGLLGLAAFGTHVLQMLHAARYETDGAVDDEAVDELFDLAQLKPNDRDRIVDALISAGQWDEEEGDARSIHDYLDHNPSKAESEAAREKAKKDKSAAGKKGAAARWGKKDEPSEPSPDDGSDMADEWQPAIDGNGPVPSRPVPSQNTPPKPSPEGRAITIDWPSVQAAFKEGFGETTYGLWLADLHPESQTDTTLTLRAPDEKAADIRSRYGRGIEAWVEHVHGSPLRVEIAKTPAELEAEEQARHDALIEEGREARQESRALKAIEGGKAA